MPHYEVFKAAPASKPRSIDQEFIEAIQSLNVGEAFTLPVDAGLKDPLAPFQRSGRKYAGGASRFRWVLHADRTAATVYRTR